MKENQDIRSNENLIKDNKKRKSIPAFSFFINYLINLASSAYFCIFSISASVKPSCSLSILISL